MIDTLDEFTEQEADPSLKQATIHGKQKLLDYYSKTDSTPVYAVATAMDPRMGPIELDVDTERQMKMSEIKKKASELDEYVHEGSMLASCKNEPPEL
ncbi:hypothetical protein BGZ89_005707, partial [Linnemannia elongata]